MFGNHGLCGLLEEGAHEKSPKRLGGTLGDFWGILQRSQVVRQGEPTPYHCNFNRLYRRIRDDRTQKSRPYRRLSLFVLGMQGIQPSRHGWSFCSAYVVLLSDVMVCPHTQNSGYALSKITKYQRVPISAKGFSKVHVLTPSTSRTSSCRNPFFL